MGVCGFVRVRRFLGRWIVAPTARSTPFLCSCAKKRGGAPKKRAFGCRHGSCSVPPASPTNTKPQHPSRLRQADLSARSTHQAPPQVGRGTSSPPTGSAHANGGAAGVKKRFSLAARHRFFGQAPKKWGRKAGQGKDHLPAYRRTRTKRNKIKGGTPGEGSPLDPLLRSNKHKESSALCGARAGALPLHPAAFEKAGETFKRASRSGGREVFWL